jgi:hypothetical protein
MPDRSLSPRGSASHDPGDPEPWGHKYTIHIYIAGPPTEQTQTMVVESVETLALPKETVFVGVGREDVLEEPRDQIAT